jgi:hypothetical protein
MSLQLATDAFKTLDFFENFFDRDLLPELNDVVAQLKDFGALESMYPPRPRFVKPPINDDIYAVIDLEGSLNKAEGDVTIVRLAAVDRLLDNDAQKVMQSHESTSNLVKMAQAERFSDWQTDKRFEAGLELSDAFHGYNEDSTQDNEDLLTSKIHEYGGDRVIVGTTRKLIDVVNLQTDNPSLAASLFNRIDKPRAISSGSAL